MFALLIGCSDYEYATKSDHAGSGDTGADWIWTDEDSDDPGGVSEGLDEFVVEGSRATDFIFFGDTSNSMAEELVSLGDQVEAFVATLAAAQTDWQLAAVTGPYGCVVGAVLDDDTADVGAAFSAAIQTSPGEDLVDEWGLYNVAQVVENTDEGECNAGLLRSFANLHVVFLSDENDDSPGSADGDPDYWQAYVDQIVAKKGSAAAVTLSAIAGPVPDGCAGADPGYGYSEAAEGTGGAFLSLCDDWVSQVNLLATEAVTQSRFPLTWTPVIETIEVHVDGVPDTSNWTYDEPGNYIEFVTNVPDSGRVVEVHYLISG